MYAIKMREFIMNRSVVGRNVNMPLEPWSSREYKKKRTDLSE